MFPKSCSKQARSPRIIKNIVIDVMRYNLYINTYITLYDINIFYALKQLSAIKSPGCTAPPFLTSNFVNGRGHRDHDPNHIVI